MQLRGPSVAGELTFATDFIPSTHQQLPHLRVFLPFLAQDEVVRWSDLAASANGLTGSLSGAELLERAGERASSSFVHPGRIVDAVTARALQACLNGLSLMGARWRGYADAVPGEVWDTDPRYACSAFLPEDLSAGQRLPEYCWDEHGEFAWGGRLYPDSLVVAAAAPYFQRIVQHADLDSVSLNRERDVLPISVAD